jgi:hypothetical protein
MEGPALAAPAQGSEAWRTRAWRDGCLILLLLLLAGGLRAWSLAHTEVASRDSIGYIRYVHELENFPLRKVLNQNQHHPGYPAVLLAVSLPVRHFCGGTTPAAMQLSAQLTSSLTGVLLVIPMFYLGRSLFDRGVGFWAAALFQCLPLGSRSMADGLSDPTYLLIAATTLLLSFRALRGSSAFLFGLCGLGAGLAYLTRPEGVVFALAPGLLLLGGQAVRAWRRPWAQFLDCGAMLLLATLAVGGPYAAVIGSFTNKTTGHRMVGETDYKHWEGEELSLAYPGARENSQPTELVRPIGRPLLASVVAVWGPRSNVPWGLRAIGIETAKGFGYVAWLPALLGLWWFRDRFRDPGAWLMLLVCLVQVLVLWRVAYVMGYVSERHVLILILCGSFWAVAAVRSMPARLAAWSPWLARQGLAKHAPACSACLLLAVTAQGLPAALKPLHTNRAGHHAAGLWLAEHAQPADQVFDPFCWSHFYAGKVFQEGIPQAAPPGYRPVGYVVFEKSDNPHARLPYFPIAKELMEHGKLVYRWLPPPRVRQRDRAEEVDIYAVPIEAYLTVLERHQW